MRNSAQDPSGVFYSRPTSVDRFPDISVRILTFHPSTVPNNGLCWSVVLNYPICIKSPRVIIFYPWNLFQDYFITILIIKYEYQSIICHYIYITLFCIFVCITKCICWSKIMYKYIVKCSIAKCIGICRNKRMCMMNTFRLKCKVCKVESSAKWLSK